MTQEQTVQLIFIILPFALTGVGVPLAMWLIAKLPVSKQSTAEKYVQLAVNAVEQLATKNTSGLTITSKKALAEQFATTMLKNVGLSVDPQVINTLIESAVFLLNAPRPVPTVVGPPQLLSVHNVPEVTNIPVSTSTYDVSAVSSTTGMVPIVLAPASPAQTL